MRIIDGANRWSENTWSQYASHYRRMYNFEQLFNIQIFHPVHLVKPPIPPSLPLMWAMQHYALQTPRNRPHGETIKYNTTRGLRSAAYTFHEIQATFLHPQTAIKDRSTDRYCVSPGSSPSEALAFHHMSTGMAKRLGTATKPSKAITWDMIQWNLDHRTRLWTKLLHQQAPPLQLYEVAAAETAELLSFLGWLRGSECFDLVWDDIDITEPHLGPSKGLRFGIGMIMLSLNHSTKSSQTKQANVVIAHATYGGLCPGLWIQRLYDLCTILNYTSSFVFRHPNGQQWTSSYYRHNILFPLLLIQRHEGNPILQNLPGMDPLTSLTTSFWSWHSYRRGGRTHVSIRHPLAARIATRDEVLEHGRWRQQATGDLPLHYQEWEFPTRLNITLLCY